VTNILTGHIGHAINKDAIDGIVHYIHVLLGQKDDSDDCAHEAARRLNLKERKEVNKMDHQKLRNLLETLATLQGLRERREIKFQEKIDSKIEKVLDKLDEVL